MNVEETKSESRPVVSDSLQPHGILQARILEWVAFPFSRVSSPPRDWTQVSCIAGGFFTSWATREAMYSWSIYRTMDLSMPVFIFTFFGRNLVEDRLFDICKIDYLTSAFYPSKFSFLYSGFEKQNKTTFPSKTCRMTAYNCKTSDLSVLVYV